VTQDNVNAILVTLARIEERLITMQKRLDQGDVAFGEIEERLSDLELRMAKMGAVAALIAVIMPIVLTALLRWLIP
jgi:inorganic triphosphatase YgiF